MNTFFYLCTATLEKIRMRKVFYNKLPEPSDIQGKKENVQTCWATFSRDADGSIGIDKWNYGNLLEVAKDAVPFKEGNLMGWTMTDGTLVVPAWFDQVEQCKHFLFLHHGDHYTTVSHRCCSPNRKDEDREYYVENSLLGLRNPKTGEHLSPAAYDYIYDWGKDCDVIYTVRDGVPRYFNHRWEPILTEWRKFPDVKDDDEPYFRSERQRLPYLILTEPVATPIDNQCCWAYNRWVRLDRIHKSEVRDIMCSHCEIQPVPEDVCYEFYSPDTYIYSARCIRSKASNPIRDCFRQLSELGCYHGTWQYLTKVWVHPNTIVPMSELRKVWRVFAIQRNSIYPNDLRNIGIGYDETLAKDEVKMFQLIFFADRWPTHEEGSYSFSLRDGSLEDFKKSRIALGQLIRRVWADGDYTQVQKEWLRHDLWEERVVPGNETSQQEWDEEKRKYEYMFRRGYSTKPTLWCLCNAIFSNFRNDYWGPAQGMHIDDLKWCCAKVGWLLEHNTDVNYICKNSTAMDFLSGALYYARKLPNEIQAPLEQMYDMVEEHGGKFLFVMYAEGQDPLTELYCKF